MRHDGVFEPIFYECFIVKKNKRLMIVDPHDQVVYCPPAFLRPVTSRKDFQLLVDFFNVNGYVGGEVLTDFETKFNPRRHK